MFDTAMLIGSYAAMSASLSVIMAKVSPNIGPRLRHLFAGGSPLVVLFAMEIADQDSVTLDGSDILASGGLLAMGVATSVAVGRFARTKGRENNRLSSR